MRMGYSRYEHEGSYYIIYRYDNVIIMQWEQLQVDGSFRVRGMFGDTKERYVSMGKSAWGGVEDYTDFIELIDWIESTSETDLVEHEPKVTEEFNCVKTSHVPVCLNEVWESRKELLIRILNWKHDEPTFHCIYEFEGFYFVHVSIGEHNEFFYGTKEGVEALYNVFTIDTDPSSIYPKAVYGKTTTHRYEHDWDIEVKLLVEKFSGEKIFKY